MAAVFVVGGLTVTQAFLDLRSPDGGSVLIATDRIESIVSAEYDGHGQRVDPPGSWIRTRSGDQLLVSESPQKVGDILRTGLQLTRRELNVRACSGDDIDETPEAGHE